jgi:NRAMP (natural resistance-associated macrophage protein)-like metal ion transporter
MGILRSFIKGMGSFDRRRLFAFLAVMGPGIITANASNDASGIATYAVAGAEFGYELLWVLFVMTISLAVIQEMSARMGVVTGKGLGDLVRERFGVKLTALVMLLLLISNLMVTIAQFAGVAAALELFGISRYFSVPISAMFVWALVVKGKYQSIEKIFLALCLVYFTYVISGFLASPPWGHVMKKLVTPSFRMDSAYIYLSIAMVGTTIAPWMQFFLQSSVADKGVQVEDYFYTKFEVTTGAFVTAFVAFFVMVTAAAVLYTNGLHIETAEEAALGLRPLAGEYAYVLFAVGFLNASLLAASIIPLSTAYAVSEAFGWESGMDKDFDEAPQFLGLYTAMIVVSAAFIMIPGLPLIGLMIVSQAVSGILLPIILVVMLILINDKEIMGEHVNSTGFNIVAWSTVVSIIIMTALLIFTTLFPDLLS